MICSTVEKSLSEATLQVYEMITIPGQGSRHFWLRQAVTWEQSELTTHSGLQSGGFPIYSGRQEQTHTPFTSRCWLFGPQGLGSQGSRSPMTSSTGGMNWQADSGSPPYPNFKNMPYIVRCIFKFKF